MSWYARVPVYAPALAVVVEGGGLNGEVSEGSAVILFLPPEDLSKLRVGQNVFFRLKENGEITRRPILAVAPQPFSPKAAQTAFNLDPRAASGIKETKAVAVANLQPMPEGTALSAYKGNSYEAWAEVGSRRVITLFPGIGRFFGG